MGRRLGLLIGMGVWCITSGCAFVNKPLNPPNQPIDTLKRNTTPIGMDVLPQPGSATDDGFFVGLALSGGGSRSANFAAACMFELQRLDLLQHVDCISAVSGGTLAGAYYCVRDDSDWNTGQVQKALSHGFATDVIVKVIMPWNFLALMFSSWDRSDILAESFRKTMYSRHGDALTYADLRTDRPRLLINATDLQSGSKFVFCNESFDELNSDLSKYPIDHAVAASAAVPVLMHHVTLRDHSTIFTRYRHILDGGINDNLGVKSLVETYAAQVKKARELKVPDPYPYGMILIVADAHTNFDTELGDRADVGLIDSLAAATGLSTTSLLNRVSSATLAELIVEYSRDDTTAQKLRDQIQHLQRTGTLLTADRDNKPVRIVHLSLSRIDEISDLPFASFGQRVNNIATYFNIDPDEVYHLYKAADLIVREPGLAKFLDELARLIKSQQK